MATKIIIVGGLLDEPERDEFTSRLQAEVSAAVTWEWIACRKANHFEPPRGVMNRVVEELNRWKSARKKDKPTEPETLYVVKLFDLHPRSENLLLRAWGDPVRPPTDVRRADELVTWMQSPEANLFPKKEWFGDATEAALIAILCKLLKNRSLNSSRNGRMWTKEQDLLGQAPVMRPEWPSVSIEASRILPSLDGSLLLSKGSGQGKTPKEWSIDTQYLPAVKQAITNNSFEPLRQAGVLAAALGKVRDGDRIYRLDDEVVNEKVKATCRGR
jgi:hypothetical protein